MLAQIKEKNSACKAHNETATNLGKEGEDRPFTTLGFLLAVLGTKYPLSLRSRHRIVTAI